MATKKPEKSKPAAPRVKVGDLEPGTDSKSSPKGGAELVRRYDIVGAFPKKY